MTLPAVARVNGNRVPDAAEFAAAARELEVLRERGDSESLYQVSAAVDAARLFHQRAEHKEAANGYARLKILAEASLGTIDLAEHPPLMGTGRQLAPLVIADREIPKNTRQFWRVIATGATRGLLLPMLERIADQDEDLATYVVSQALSRAGVMWTIVDPLKAAFDQSGMTRSELASRLGSPGGGQWSTQQSNVTHLFGTERNPRTGSLWFPKARRVADALGMDITQLPVVPKAMWNRDARLRWSARRRAAQRALAEKERERAIKQAVRKAGAAVAELYSIAERTQDVLGQAQREVADKEARIALSLAGEHYRKMRDEIVRALGVSC